jgi:hypothetical protein
VPAPKRGKYMKETPYSTTELIERACTSRFIDDMFIIVNFFGFKWADIEKRLIKYLDKHPKASQNEVKEYFIKVMRRKNAKSKFVSETE